MLDVHAHLQATRAVLQTFEKYQKERVAFVTAVAEMAKNPQNIEALQQAGAMALLRPLLLDNVPSIQQSAALALGRLANYSDDLAEAVVQNEILPQLVYSLSEQNRFYKQAAAFCLRAVAKHSPELAQAVIDSGSLDSLVTCLEEFDPGVKEAAAWTLGYIAGHNAELSQQDTPTLKELHVEHAGDLHMRLGVPLQAVCMRMHKNALQHITMCHACLACHCLSEAALKMQTLSGTDDVLAGGGCRSSSVASVVCTRARAQPQTDCSLFPLRYCQAHA
eukprot:scaffold53973_cov23-Tisochrysis_lutea.AAC.3